MIQPRVYEGTAEEIAAQPRASNLPGKWRAVVVPEEGLVTQDTPDADETLAERLKGRLGRFDFGDANLSEDTSRKFTELLVEKHRTG